jgi:hypothetical protein
MSNKPSSMSMKHVPKKSKHDINDQPSTSARHSCRTMNPAAALEPRRDLPLHKIPELLAKITGSLSSTISSCETKPSSSIVVVSSSDRRLQLFEQYANGDLMLLDGLLRFCVDLSVEPDCYEVLLFCFLCRAKQMYSLTKNEFVLGLKTLGPHLDTFADLWTYHYGLTDGQRCLTTGNAISLWRLFYSKRVDKPVVVEQWLDYLERDNNHDIPKGITCDTWTIFPQFAKFIHTNGYAAYDDSEAWPCLFDDFVDYQVEHRRRSHSSACPD